MILLLNNNYKFNIDTYEYQNEIYNNLISSSIKAELQYTEKDLTSLRDLYNEEITSVKLFSDDDRFLTEFTEHYKISQLIQEVENLNENFSIYYILYLKEADHDSKN